MKLNAPFSLLLAFSILASSVLAGDGYGARLQDLRQTVERLKHSQKDHPSPELAELERELSSLQNMAARIDEATSAQKNLETKARSLKEDIESQQRQAQPLANSIEQKGKDYNDRISQIVSTWDNSGLKRTYNVPDEQGAYNSAEAVRQGYQRQIDALKQQITDLTTGPEAQQLEALEKKQATLLAEFTALQEKSAKLETAQQKDIDDFNSGLQTAMAALENIMASSQGAGSTADPRLFRAGSAMSQLLGESETSADAARQQDAGAAHTRAESGFDRQGSMPPVPYTPAARQNAATTGNSRSISPEIEKNPHHQNIIKDLPEISNRRAELVKQQKAILENPGNFSQAAYGNTVKEISGLDAKVVWDNYQKRLLESTQSAKPK